MLQERVCTQPYLEITGPSEHMIAQAMLVTTSLSC